MTDANEKRLGMAFIDWVTQLPQEDVIRRYRALLPNERLAVEGYAYEESRAALNSGEAYGSRLEVLAKCFDVFAAGEDVPPLYSSAGLFRKRAHALRHPEEWRERQRAAATRDRLSARRLQALALASSCLAQGPIDVRLRRIEDVLSQLNQLADQAVAEGDLDDESAIGEDIVGLWRLRDDLRAGS